MTIYREMRHPWFSESDLFTTLESSDPLIEKIQQDHGQASAHQAWVLDLDSTLFSTSTRNREIFASYLNFKKDVPESWSKALHELQPLSQSFGVRESLEWALKKHVDQDLAYQESHKIWSDYQLFWEHHFFSSEFMNYDEPHMNAVSFVKKIWDLGYQVVYMTGRDMARSLDGTIESLKNWGFPNKERTELILKPGFRWSMSDVEFKEMASKQVSSKFEVLCSIDNEPENLNAFARFFPKSEIVLYHSVMSNRAPTSPIRDHLQNRKLWLLKNF